MNNYLKEKQYAKQLKTLQESVNGLFLYAEKTIIDGVAVHKVILSNKKHLVGQCFQIPVQSHKKYVNEVVKTLASFLKQSESYLLVLDRHRHLKVCFIEDGIEQWLRIEMHPIKEYCQWGLFSVSNEKLEEDW